MSAELFHICLTPERCICAGRPEPGAEPKDECCCIREHDDRLVTRCLACLAAMRALDQSTGEFLKTKPKTKGHAR